jgi:hypothetical protein
MADRRVIPQGGISMRKPLLALAVAALWLAGSAHGQVVTDQFATGNMHFDAKAMDANGDGKITQEEAMNYARSMWKTMAAGRKTIPVQEAAEDFARGNMKLDAQSMDTKHEGTISESEFMSAVQHRFNKMKDPNGTMTVVGAAQAFSRGNQSVASESAHSVER